MSVTALYLTYITLIDIPPKTLDYFPFSLSVGCGKAAPPAGVLESL